MLAYSIILIVMVNTHNDCSRECIEDNVPINQIEQTEDLYRNRGEMQDEYIEDEPEEEYERTYFEEDL